MTTWSARPSSSAGPGHGRTGDGDSERHDARALGRAPGRRAPAVERGDAFDARRRRSTRWTPTSGIRSLRVAAAAAMASVSPSAGVSAPRRTAGSISTHDRVGRRARRRRRVTAPGCAGRGHGHGHRRCGDSATVGGPTACELHAGAGGCRVGPAPRCDEPRTTPAGPGPGPRAGRGAGGPGRPIAGEPVDRDALPRAARASRGRGAGGQRRRRRSPGRPARPASRMPSTSAWAGASRPRRRPAASSSSRNAVPLRLEQQLVLGQLGRASRGRAGRAGGRAGATSNAVLVEERLGRRARDRRSAG